MAGEIRDVRDEGRVVFERQEAETTEPRGGRARVPGGRTSGPGPLPTPLRRGRRGPGLSSTRDRRRLRERSAAERARVEAMLASAPLPADPEVRPAQRRSEEVAPGTARGAAQLRAIPSSPPPCCPVCARADVFLDEVSHAGTLILAACRHCDHRWTSRPPRRFAAVGAAMGGASSWLRSSNRVRGERGTRESALRVAAQDPDLLLDLPF